MTSTTATALDFGLAPLPPTSATLLDLVSALTGTGATDEEVVAAVMDLIETGRAKLVGEIGEHHLLGEAQVMS